MKNNRLDVSGSDWMIVEEPLGKCPLGLHVAAPSLHVLAKVSNPIARFQSKVSVPQRSESFLLFQLDMSTPVVNSVRLGVGGMLLC